MQAYGNSQHGEPGMMHRGHGHMYDQIPQQGPHPQTPTGPQQNAAYTGAYAINNAMANLSLHGNGHMPGHGLNTPMSAGHLGLGHLQAGNHASNYMQGGGWLWPFAGFPPYATMPRHGVVDSSNGGAQMPFHPHMHLLAPPGLGHGYQYVPLTPQPTLAELPGLEDRRSSSGSKEERGHSSSPDTPFLGATNQTTFNAGTRNENISPRIHYGYETPSPPNYLPATKNLKHTESLPECSVVGANKIIPPPVMAGVYPPGSRKPLDLCLMNPNHTKNVYIRGLNPNTSDEMLLAYGSLFGIVESAKAIIEIQTSNCKGFGFLLYYKFEHAERCIRDFYVLGYEASFARESFNHTLKSLSDPSSSNLYFSNLPKNMNETELDAILVNYNIESTRILRDPFGNSRGVGFARLKNRDECDEVIKTFNGHPVGEEGLLLQVRYADTEPQRHLKKETQQRRDFRSKEHNIAVYGSPVPRFQTGRYRRFATFPRAQVFQRGPLTSSLGGSAGEKVAQMMEISDKADKESTKANDTTEAACSASQKGKVSASVPSSTEDSDGQSPVTGGRSLLH